MQDAELKELELNKKYSGESQKESLLQDSSPRKDHPYIQNNDQKKDRKKGMHRIGIPFALLIITLLAFYIIYSWVNKPVVHPHQNSKSIKDQANKITITSKDQHQFPRILWVQTDHELETKQMQEIMVAQNLIHFGNRSGFEVRVVNNLNAYDWLEQESIQFIKDTHQKSKIDLPVLQLLRLALLYEHGGVFIRLPNILLLSDLSWVDILMKEGGFNMDETSQKALNCQLRDPQVLLHHHDKDGDAIQYKDDFIAAKPKVQLFKVLQEQISRIAKKGIWPYSDQNITTVNQDTLVISFPGITETLINHYHRHNLNLCEKYGFESFHDNYGVFMADISDKHTSSTLRSSEQKFKMAYGQKYLLRLDMEKATDDIINIIQTGDLSFGEGNSILKNKLMLVEGNKWLTIPSSKTRKVQLCIVALKPQTIQEYALQMKKQLGHLAQQTFTNWRIVNFIKGLPSVSRNVSERIFLVNASIYEGLNLQRAATKYCDPKSVIFLLDQHETLSTVHDLQVLANIFKPIGAFAAFLNVKTAEKVFSPSIVKKEVQRTINKPQIQLLSEIGNLLRAFTVQMYRFIAHIDLRNSYGRYFDRQIALLSILELGEGFSPCEKGKLAYHTRRLEQVMAMPREKLFPPITINSNQLKQIDTSRYEYYGKYRYYRLCEAIILAQDYYNPVELIAVFNNGKEEQGLASRRDMPQLIQKRIHQIWVKGEVPNFKKFLMKKLKDAHPDYEYFLWTQKNITKDNFPQSYDLLQTLLEFDKRSPYNKMASIADIIRLEVVYRHGGFYLDTNVMLFGEHTLDQFRSFAFMSIAELAPRHRVLRDNGFFGAIKYHSSIGQLVSHRSLSSRNHYLQYAVKETGPNYLGRVQRGNDEQNETMFQPSFQQFYPNFAYDYESNNYNKCETVSTTPETEILFRSPKRAYLKNCSQIYNYSFGMKFGVEGASWIYRRW